MGTEIERKWLIKNSDALSSLLKKAAVVPIQQFYTKITDDEEERYRIQNRKYFKTIKRGSGMTRTENEIEIDKAEFIDKSNHMIGLLIFKLRYITTLLHYDARYDELKLEFDLYVHPSLKSKAILEIEFKNEEDAKSFRIVEDLKKFIGDAIEITDDKRFKNKNIAFHGFPDSDLLI